MTAPIPKWRRAVETSLWKNWSDEAKERQDRAEVKRYSEKLAVQSAAPCASSATAEIALRATTDDDKREIIRLVKVGNSQKQIGEWLGLTKGQVSGVVHRHYTRRAEISA